MPRFDGLRDGAKEPLDFLCHHCALVYVIIIITWLANYSLILARNFSVNL